MLDHTLEEEFADLKPLILCSESADYVQPLDKVLCCAFIGGPGYLTCAGCRSKWNQANRFTGWTDVDISHAGHLQALRAGNMLKAHGFVFDVCFTSVLRRAIRTQWVVLEAMDLLHCQGTPDLIHRQAIHALLIKCVSGYASVIAGIAQLDMKNAAYTCFRIFFRSCSAAKGLHTPAEEGMFLQIPTCYACWGFHEGLPQRLRLRSFDIPWPLWHALDWDELFT